MFGFSCVFRVNTKMYMHTCGLEHAKQCPFQDFGNTC